jgi:hypothetical protein
MPEMRLEGSGCWCRSVGVPEEIAIKEYNSRRKLVPRIPDEYLDCVIYLYRSEKDADEGARIGGSGFLVGVMTETAPMSLCFVYAVTNRHVVEHGGTVIRMTTADAKKEILLTENCKWHVHPAGDDLAICQIKFDPKVFKFHFIDRRHFLDQDMVKRYGIGPGDDAFTVGRFINHEGKQRNHATARFGCIAQMPCEPIRQDTGFEQESFLVEARSTSGYSGSPVFLYVPAFSGGPSRFNTNWSLGPWLLGITWGHINDYEPVRDEKYRPVEPANPKKMQVRINTGMMAVVPAWKLAEMLDDQDMVAHRNRELEKVRVAMEKN